MSASATIGAAKYPNVFRPVKIGPVEIKNRFYLSPHGNPYMVGSAPSDAFARYYGARAAGGCGLLIHALNVIPGRVQPSVTPFPDSTVPSFRAVAEHIHANGAKIFGQLHYSRVGGSSWRYDPGSSVAPNFAPSAVQVEDDFMVTYELPIHGIKRLVEAYRTSARHLAEAGYDGIEVHCSHGMLAEAFLSPYFNHRTDEYGGSLENRMRLLVEFLQASRDGVGPTRAVGMRFNVDERIEGGLTQEDTKEILGRLVAMKLIDFVDMDWSIEPDQHPTGMPPYTMPQRIYEKAVANVRTAAGPIPVLSVLGRITSVADAETALAKGVVDLVGATRGLMAEPNLVRNALEGHEEDSRICLACNLCMRRSRGTWGCAINPATGREGRWGDVPPAPRKVTVVVAGAGPGGLEAARVAALRGHSVLVLEKSSKIGGQLNLWASLPGRDVFRTTVEWYERQLAKLGVQIRFGVDATADTVLAEKPNAVIVATGAHYVRDGTTGFRQHPIPGWDQSYVYTVEQVLEDRILPSGRVVVLDEEGLNAAAGIAELLAAVRNADVDLVTRHIEPMWNVLATFEGAVILPRLKKMGVNFVTSTYIKKIGDHSVTYYDVDTLRERVVTGVAAVIMAAARTPNTRLAYELEGKVPQVFAVGDALAPRGLTEPIHEAHRFARMIGEPDGPTDFIDAFFRPWPANVYQQPAAMLAERLTPAKA